MPATATAAQIAAMSAALREGGRPGDAGARPADGGEALVDLIGELERLKSAACAVQAEAAVAYDAVRRSAESEAGVPARRQGRGVAAEVGLARQETPHQGRTLLGLARALHHEMPHTRARLLDGTLSEFRALLLVRETACLTAEQRTFVDEELCVDPIALDGVGTRQLVARAKRIGCELDPAAVVRRARNAVADRCVTVRPAPDTMTYLTGLLPVAQGVAVHAALGRDADRLRARGDDRSRGQLMADLLVARVTGVDLPRVAGAATNVPPAVPVTINLTMSDLTLLGGHAPAEIGGDGVVPETVPAETARLLAGRTLEASVAAWIRRLYVAPTGELVAMTGKQRLFAEGLAGFLDQRDQGICRTPWCGAPIRHHDHITPVVTGGRTTAANGQGLCAACNHAKQAPGWRQTVPDEPGARHAVETITPTGHRYRSTAPPPVGWREPRWIKDRPGGYLLVA